MRVDALLPLRESRAQLHTLCFVLLHPAERPSTTDPATTLRDAATTPASCAHGPAATKARREPPPFNRRRSVARRGRPQRLRPRAAARTLPPDQPGRRIALHDATSSGCRRGATVGERFQQITPPLGSATTGRPGGRVVCGRNVNRRSERPTSLPQGRARRRDSPARPGLHRSDGGRRDLGV